MTLSIPDCGAAAAGGALVLDDGVPLAVASPTLDGSALGVGVDVCVPAASPTRFVVEVTLPLLVAAPREENSGRLACVLEPDPLIGAMDGLRTCRIAAAEMESRRVAGSQAGHKRHRLTGSLAVAAGGWRTQPHRFAALQGHRTWAAGRQPDLDLDGRNAPQQPDLDRWTAHGRDDGHTHTGTLDGSQ
jgi:hypothetical protein